MSTVVPVPKIDNAMVLPTMYLNRAIAKLLVTNRESDFTLLGISYAGNLPRQGRLHQLTGNLMDNMSQLGNYYNSTGYLAEAGPSDDGTIQGTWSNPIYVYETLPSYKAFFIIHGEYKGKEYYYKTELTDASGNFMAFYRQTSYSFNISSVTGPGYTNLQDALISAPSNAVDYVLTVNEPDGYEIIANNDYYMAVSNSHYVIHTPGGTGESYVAFTIITNCTRNFQADNIISMDPAVPGVTLSHIKVPVSTSSLTIAKTDIKITVSSAFTTGTIRVRLGNLDKTITIERRERIASGGAVLSNFVTGGQYASASIVDIQYADWLKLSPHPDRIPAYYESIHVDNGQIYLHVDSNTGSSVRKNGVVYIGTSSTMISPKRIKFEVEQSN